MKSIITFFATLALPALAVAAPTDFDADGTSEFLLVNIEQAGLEWVTSPSSAGLPATFGQVGNDLMPADYLGTGIPQLATVELNSATKEVTWKVKVGSGSQSLVFGVQGDALIGGADFNHNGCADAAIVKTVGGSLVWTVHFDPFSSSCPQGASEQSVERSYVFGRKGEAVFYGNVDGTGDQFGVRTKGRLGTHLKFLHPSTLVQRKGGILSAANATAQAPLPIKNQEGVSNYAFVMRRGTRTSVDFRTLAGTRVASKTLSGVGDIVVGNFDNTLAGEELAIKTSTGFSVFNPISKTISATMVSGTVAVDEININGFSNCTVGDPTDGYKTGFIWKPVSDTQRFAVVVFPPNLTGSIKSAETRTVAGQTIQKLRSKGAGNGNREAWQDDRYTGADYQKQHGAIVVHVEQKDGGCLTYAIRAPKSRID